MAQTGIGRPAVAGGVPIRRDYLVFGLPSIGEAEIEEVVATLRSGWIGTGPRTFATPVAYPTGHFTIGLMVADFNHDGILDLATANRNTNDVSILIGQGSGGVVDQRRWGDRWVVDGTSRRALHLDEFAVYTDEPVRSPACGAGRYRRGGDGCALFRRS